MGKFGTYFAAGEVTAEKFKNVSSPDKKTLFNKVYVPKVGEKFLRVFFKTKTGALSYGQRVRSRYINKLIILKESVKNG